MARLPRPVITSTSVSPARTASSTTYWMAGLSTIGSISLGWLLVAGRKRVPSPAAGSTALVTAFAMFATLPPLARRLAETVLLAAHEPSEVRSVPENDHHRDARDHRDVERAAAREHHERRRGDGTHDRRDRRLVQP